MASAIGITAHLVETEQFSKTTQAQTLGGSRSLASEALTGGALRAPHEGKVAITRKWTKKDRKWRYLVSKMAGRSLPTYLWQLAYAPTRFRSISMKGTVWNTPLPVYALESKMRSYYKNFWPNLNMTSKFTPPPPAPGRTHRAPPGGGNLYYWQMWQWHTLNPIWPGNAKHSGCRSHTGLQ